MESRTIPYNDYLKLKKRVRNQDKKIQKLNEEINDFHNKNVETEAHHFTELSRQINKINISLNSRINSLIYWILGTGIAVIGIIVAILK